MKILLSKCFLRFIIIHTAPGVGVTWTPVPGEILNRRDLTFDEDSGWGPWLVTGLAQSESFKGGPDPWPDSHEWLRDTKSTCPQKK